MERIEFSESRSLSDAVAAAERGDEVVVVRAGSVVAEVRATTEAKRPLYDLVALRSVRDLAKPLQIEDSALLIREMRDADDN